MKGKMASWMDKWSLCVVHSMTKATTCSQHWRIIWQPFHINKRGQYYRVPVLSLVVVWQLCTFGSLLINQRARALLWPTLCMWKYGHTKDSLIYFSWRWEQRENRRSDQSKFHHWRSSLFTVFNLFCFSALWRSTVVSIMSAFQSRLSLKMQHIQFDEQGAKIRWAEVTRYRKCETRQNTCSPNNTASTRILCTSGTKPLMCSLLSQQGGKNLCFLFTGCNVNWCHSYLELGSSDKDLELSYGWIIGYVFPI